MDAMRAELGTQLLSQLSAAERSELSRLGPELERLQVRATASQVEAVLGCSIAKLWQSCSLVTRCLQSHAGSFGWENFCK